MSQLTARMLRDRNDLQIDHGADAFLILILYQSLSSHDHWCLLIAGRQHDSTTHERLPNTHRHRDEFK